MSVNRRGRLEWWCDFCRCKITAGSELLAALSAEMHKKKCQPMPISKIGVQIIRMTDEELQEIWRRVPWGDNAHRAIWDVAQKAERERIVALLEVERDSSKNTAALTFDDMTSFSDVISIIKDGLA